MIEKIGLISVIIPVFNREQTIKKCIESVLNQTYTNFEVIVVNDCSTDGTQEIISQIQDVRVKLVNLEKNSGAQIARNEGIIAAKGEWIAFLDSDDFWEYKKLELQMREVKKLNYKNNIVIHGNCYCLDLKKEKKWLWQLPPTEAMCYTLLLARPAPLFPSILTSKQALYDIGLLDITAPSYQEWDTTISLSKKCEFIHLKEPLFTYVFHDGDTISKNKNRDIDGYWYIVNKFRNDMLNYGCYRSHIVNLLVKSISFGLYERAYEFLELLDIPLYKKRIVLTICQKRLKLNKVFNKVLRTIL